MNNQTKGSNIVNHTWQNLSIDFGNAYVINKCNYRVQKTLESWHTAKMVDADNNSKHCLGNTPFYCNQTPFTFFIAQLCSHLFSILVLKIFSYLFPFARNFYSLKTIDPLKVSYPGFSSIFIPIIRLVQHSCQH